MWRQFLLDKVLAFAFRCYKCFFGLLFLGRNIPEKDDQVFQQFEKYTVVDSITTPYARENGVKIILYENGNDKVNKMIESGIKEKKDEYRR